MKDASTLACAKLFIIVFLLCFVVSGMVQLSLAVHEATTAWKLTRHAQQAEGIIVDFVIRQNSSGKVAGGRSSSCLVSYPVVRFAAAEGERSFTNPLGQCNTSYTKQQKVPVLYFSDAAEGTPVINGFWDRWFPAILYGGIGILTLGFSVFLLRFILKPAIIQRKKPKDS